MATLQRTDAVELDQDFEYVGEIVKSYVDERTGKRVIVGAATGVEEDQDGERMARDGELLGGRRQQSFVVGELAVGEYQVDARGIAGVEGSLHQAPVAPILLKEVVDGADALGG